MRGAHVAAILALCAAALQASSLLGNAYFTYAEQHLDLPDAPRTVAASRAAATLAPWSSRYLALAGWLLATREDDAESQAYYRRALRWAPADALLWQEFALTLAQHGRYQDLTVPLQRSQALAPASPAVQSANAAMGLAHWAQGPDPARALWLASMRYELDHDRPSFLRGVVARGDIPLFCGSLASMLGEERWCQRIDARLHQCESLRPGSENDILCLLGG